MICHYMNNILLTHSNVGVLEEMSQGIRKRLPCWGLQISPKNTKRRESMNYLWYKVGLQTIQPQKV